MKNKDLFNNIDELPEQVQGIILKYSEADTYEELNSFLDELKPLGYVFDYYLDCLPFNLRKI